jgi:hypothetical protein
MIIYRDTCCDDVPQLLLSFDALRECLDLPIGFFLRMPMLLLKLVG